ncbi:MAG TPA: Auxin-binding protein [Pseudohongiella sp.]|mgnify:FL=1|nr:Auxin-binding protein [Pseudohongiella sp.]HBX37545.1 Auxin-binding protein [Pseudohongiella sp.]|tara:strand:- start:4564 stop:4968 length:405 start_codon:yes stop_codon:yes gene_type:complete
MTANRIMYWLTGLALVLTASTAQAATVQTQSTPSGLQIEMQSQLQPLTINQMHGWVISLTDTQGQAVNNADITVTGGMPEHDHGLATSPRITQQLGDGQYLLQGVRFHMPGLWQLELLIQVEEITYRAQVELNL